MSRALPRSATAVALLADIPSTGHVGEVRAQRFAMHGDGIGERSAAFVDFARARSEAGQKVVALYPSWQAETAERAVNFARGATRDDHVAGIAVDLSPLALSLVADQLAYLAPYVPPGMVAALSDELPKHLLAGAWLGNVSQVAGFPVSLRQQMSSLAPSVSYLAYCAPSRSLGRLRPSEVARTLPFQPVRPVQLLCSTPDPAITGVFDAHLPHAIAPVATRRLPAQPLGPAYWGTSKYVEFVALSAHPQALAYAASSLRTALCAWCGEPVRARPCPFCAGNATRPMPPRPASSSPPQGGSAAPGHSGTPPTGTRSGAEPGTRPAARAASGTRPAPAPPAHPSPGTRADAAPAPTREPVRRGRPRNGTALDSAPPTGPPAPLPPPEPEPLPDLRAHPVPGHPPATEARSTHPR
ncbi:hypothetical protein IDM40_27005 [Nocardiopsis sp. HNM0947]|uniref:Basic proline-rich protein n=1 Tax=Nocardiopsis coralli TaxID=2772213 RepID=A0ABR9PEP7_9ACTN|nr:hypothetical protein [Nocardiopsis coralli]MBE3002321.1 hypothetical protein [Nocardiopsis coralli]